MITAGIVVAALGLVALLLVQGVAPITSLATTISSIFNSNATQTLPNAPTAFPQFGPSGNITRAVQFTTGTTTARGANQQMAKIISVTAGGSTTIDLSAAFTNIVNASNATFARIKGIRISLLSPTDDSVNGTLASSITIGNNGSNDFISQSGNRGWLGSAASVFDLANGNDVCWKTVSANGVLVDATHKIIKITNNDGAVAAAVMVEFLGADA